MLVVVLARALSLRATPLALALALATGVTWTTNGLEGTAAVGSLSFAVAMVVWRRRDPLVLVAFGTSAVILTAYGLWHGGFPPPSTL